MIYILEGADGCGKSTLANTIAEETKGHILHCSYSKDWNIHEYHLDVFAAALSLSKYQDVIIDRWAPSEWVYGNVFRGKESYNVFTLIEAANTKADITWIMCKNVNAVANHLKNKEKREEMFESMYDVVANFSIFESDTPELNWIDYDYDKVNMKQFVKELVK